MSCRGSEWRTGASPGAAWCGPAGGLGAQWRPTWACCCLACHRSHEALCSVPSPAKQKQSSWPHTRQCCCDDEVALGVKLSTRWSWSGHQAAGIPWGGACGGAESPFYGAKRWAEAATLASHLRSEKPPLERVRQWCRVILGCAEAGTGQGPPLRGASLCSEGVRRWPPHSENRIVTVPLSEAMHRTFPEHPFAGGTQVHSVTEQYLPGTYCILSEPHGLSKWRSW